MGKKRKERNGWAVFGHWVGAVLEFIFWPVIAFHRGFRKLRFVDDGKINGWIIGVSIVFFDFTTIFIAQLGVKTFLDAWDKIGDKIIFLSVVMTGMWFLSKRMQDIAAIVLALLGLKGKLPIDVVANAINAGGEKVVPTAALPKDVAGKIPNQ